MIDHNKVKDQMIPIAEGIQRRLVATTGQPVPFALVVFSDGQASYISNCDRQQAFRELKDFVAHFEKEQLEIGSAKTH